MTTTLDTVIIDNTDKDLETPVPNVPDVLVWVDKETTGLNPREDMVLELGVVVTDFELNVLHQNSWYVREEGWLDQLKKSTEAYDMHIKSGLVAELAALPEYNIFSSRRASDTQTSSNQIMDWSHNAASFLAWKWLTEDLELPAGEYPMCGSSVHFDRKFAEVHLPVFNSFFTYRNIDISTLKELCKRFNPRLYGRIHKETGFDKANSKHRVTPDIMDTLKEAAFYFDNFLWVAPRGDDPIENQPILPGM